MDSQQQPPQEGSHSDLQHALDGLREFWQKYGSTLLLSVLLCALLVVGWNLWRSVRTAAHDTAWDDLAGTTSPDTYPLVAEDHSNKTVKILANLWGADAQLNESLTKPAGDGPFDPLSQAEGMYNEVLAMTEEPVYRANAYLGLASVAESRQQYDKAGEYYDKAAAESGDTYAALKMRAEQRKAMLSRLDEPVVFGTTSLLPPEEAPAEAPAAESAPTEAPPAEPASTEPAPAETEPASPAE